MGMEASRGAARTPGMSSPNLGGKGEAASERSWRTARVQFITYTQECTSSRWCMTAASSVHVLLKPATVVNDIGKMDTTVLMTNNTFTFNSNSNQGDRGDEETTRTKTEKLEELRFNKQLQKTTGFQPIEVSTTKPFGHTRLCC